MKRRTVFFILFAMAVLPSAVFSQTSTAAPAFDIADVHPSPRADWVRNQTHLMMGGYLSGDRYELRRATLLDMIRTAYDVEPDRIYGGPNWLDYDRFEIAAKTKPGTSPATLRLMLRTLLTDRFGLVVKPDTAPVPGYTLSRADAELKLKPSGAGTNVGCQTSVRMSMGAGASPPEHSTQCHEVTLQSFAVSLGRALSSPAATFPVVDATGVEGTWDIDLRYTEEPAVGNSVNTGLAAELRKLGLSLEFGKVPQPVLTVEKANQPSANAPGVADALPARPLPEFEAASVRLANNESGGSRTLLFQAGGRATAAGMAPGILIEQAWNLSSLDQIVGLPKSFLGSSVSKNISIVGKAPEGWFPENAATANAGGRDLLYAMLRRLLIERYKMEVHFEDRPMDAITLTANKPKLTKADPTGRTGCKRESQQRQGTALIVKLVCRNITMDQFAEQMPGLDTGIIYPVQNSTGLEGAWDFTLNFDALARLAGMMRVGPPPQTDGATPDASDPSGSLSFMEAVQKQLGLKAETHKRPEPVLVIDHMLDEPVDN